MLQRLMAGPCPAIQTNLKHCLEECITGSRPVMKEYGKQRSLRVIQHHGLLRYNSQ